MNSEIAILEYLSEVKKTLRYKGMKVGFLGLPDFKYYKYQTLANRCHLLKKKGFIKENKTGEYYITNKGRIYLKKQKSFLKNFEKQNNENLPKDLLIVYDIEEKRKKEREWFRYHLRKFNFIMIQRSVWIGPSPLPKDFIDYLKKIKLGDNLKTFKLAKGYELK
jgi:DNA-binding transcriptional regulator PaaX